MSTRHDPVKAAIRGMAMQPFNEGKRLGLDYGYRLFGIDNYNFQLSIEMADGQRRHFTVQVKESK